MPRRGTDEARQTVYESLAPLYANIIHTHELGYVHLELPGNITANEAMTELLQSDR